MKSRVATLIVGLLLLLAALPYFGAWVWWLDMGNHFRLQLAVGSLITAILLIAWLRQRWIYVVCLAPILWFAPIVPTLFPGFGLQSGSVTVAHINVGDCDPERVRSWIEQLNPAVRAVMLLEVRPGDALVTTAPDGWHFELQRPTDDTRGLAVLVRDKQTASVTVESFTVPGTTRDMAVLELGRLKIMQAHLARPGYVGGFAEQQAISNAIADWTQALTPDAYDVVVVGDFNAAPWSAAVTPLREAGLRPASGALSGTWPSGLPQGMRVPIDHAFGDVAADVTVGPDLGGDHRPIVVEIAQ